MSNRKTFKKSLKKDVEEYPEDFDDLPPRKRPKLQEAGEDKKRFSHQRPDSPSQATSSGITSSSGSVMKAVRYGDSLIQYEAAPVVLDSLASAGLHSSRGGSNAKFSHSIDDVDSAIVLDDDIDDGAGAPSGSAPSASFEDEIAKEHELEAELNVAGDFAPLSIGSRTAMEVESHVHAPGLDEPSLKSRPEQEDLLDAFIPLEAPSKRQRANSRNSPKPTTPGGKNPLPEKYLSVFNNEVGTHAKLPPWAATSYQKGHWCLSDEIKDFVRWIEPTQLEKVMRQDLINRVSNVILSCFPHSDPQVFGSYSTQLFLPLSDIDMVVLRVDPLRGNLRRLASALVRAKVCPYPQVIDKAKVPIVKFVDSKTGIQVDVSFNQENGVHNTAVVNNYLKEFEALRPLVMVLKYYMQSRDLQEPYTGGVGSYALTLMVVSFLQQQAHYENGKPETNLGYLLIDFFDFYGYAFNYYTTGISVRHGGSYFNKMNVDWYDYSQPFLMAIEDPNDETNDVGRPSYRVPFVRMAFQESLQRLTNNASQDYAPTLLSRIIQPMQHTERARAHWRVEFASLVTTAVRQEAQEEKLPPHKRRSPPPTPQLFPRKEENSAPRFKPYEEDRSYWRNKSNSGGDRDRSDREPHWRSRGDKDRSPPRGNKKYKNEYGPKRKRS